MNKKFYISILFLLLAGFFVACSNEKAPPKKKKVVKVERKGTTEKEETASTDDPNSEPTPPENIEKAKEIIASVDADAVAAVDGKLKFKTLCAICHGLKGDLQVNGAKNLKKSKISLAESVAQIYFGKGLMTPFKGILKDAEIVAVAKYVETMRE